MTEKGHEKPKHLGLAFDLVVFTSERFWAVHAKDSVTALSHFFSSPSRQVFLEITVLTFLGDKAIGGENNDAAGGQLLHLIQHLPPVFLWQVFNYVQRDAGVEAAFLEKVRYLPDVTQEVGIVGFGGFGFLQRWGITIHSFQDRPVQETKRGGVSTANIQHGFAFPETGTQFPYQHVNGGIRQALPCETELGSLEDLAGPPRSSRACSILHLVSQLTSQGLGPSTRHVKEQGGVNGA